MAVKACRVVLTAFRRKDIFGTDIVLPRQVEVIFVHEPRVFAQFQSG